jgi:prepilin-type N-terminal cleavage/methylation domain-containing protein
LSGHSAERRRAGFTLVEVLAALAFMAIVIPVALSGVSVASHAGEVSYRKMLAVRQAEYLLGEAVATSQWTQAIRNGTTKVGTLEFQWTVRSELWPMDAMRKLSAEVFYTAQGRKYSVLLATLVNQ